MQSQPTPGLPPELGLPPSWAPVAITWHLAKLEVQSPAGRDTLHLLMFDTPLGRSAYALPHDALLRFIDQLQTQATGLTIARAMLPNVGENGGRHA